MQLSKVKSIHFTGMKGVAMCALALCANDLGISITGSDTDELFVTDELLKERGIKWEVGFKEKEWKQRPDLLIATGSHGGLDNPEVISARKVKIPVITQGEAISFFSSSKKLISTCGVGGKTTTASMIAHILSQASFNPSYAIGVGKIFPLGFPGKFSKKGDYFVCEADEYALSPGQNNKPKFSVLNPYITVVTNIEHDHPDIYPTIKETKKAFKSFNISKKP